MESFTFFQPSSSVILAEARPVFKPTDLSVTSHGLVLYIIPKIINKGVKIEIAIKII